MATVEDIGEAELTSNLDKSDRRARVSKDTHKAKVTKHSDGCSGRKRAAADESPSDVGEADNQESPSKKARHEAVPTTADAVNEKPIQGSGTEAEASEIDAASA